LADIRDSRQVLVKKTVNGYHSAGAQVNEVPLAGLGMTSEASYRRLFGSLDFGHGINPIMTMIRPKKTKSIDGATPGLPS
jgi:hypothetical protein